MVKAEERQASAAESENYNNKLNNLKKYERDKNLLHKF